MARISIRVRFNKGRLGVSLSKLENVVGEVRHFLEMLGEDVGIMEDLGDWQGFDFQNESISFIASKPVPEAERGKVPMFNQAVSDLTHRRETGIVRNRTRFQFSKIAQSIEADEAVHFGIYEHPADELNEQANTEPDEWVELTKDKALTISSEIERAVKSYGSVQGVIHSVFFGAQPPHFKVRELSTGDLIDCIYKKRKYSEIAMALQKQDAIVHVYGIAKMDMLDRKIESMSLERLELAEVMTEEEFEKFRGCSPGILGDQSLQEFIDDMRDRGEKA